jgi:hypothetical protein
MAINISIPKPPKNADPVSIIDLKIAERDLVITLAKHANAMRRVAMDSDNRSVRSYAVIQLDRLDDLIKAMQSDIAAFLEGEV